MYVILSATLQYSDNSMSVSDLGIECPFTHFTEPCQYFCDSFRFWAL